MNEPDPSQYNSLSSYLRAKDDLKVYGLQHVDFERFLAALDEGEANALAQLAGDWSFKSDPANSIGAPLLANLWNWRSHDHPDSYSWPTKERWCSCAKFLVARIHSFQPSWIEKWLDYEARQENPSFNRLRVFAK